MYIYIFLLQDPCVSVCDCGCVAEKQSRSKLDIAYSDSPHEPVLQWTSGPPGSRCRIEKGSAQIKLLKPEGNLSESSPHHLDQRFYMILYCFNTHPSTQGRPCLLHVPHCNGHKASEKHSADVGNTCRAATLCCWHV